MEHTSENSAEREGQNGNGVHALASRAEEKAKELQNRARMEAQQRAQELGEKAQERIDAERDRVAGRIEDAAARVRERGDSAGSLGHMAGEQVATRMEAAAGYLHQHKSDEIAGDFASYVKQHPIQAVIAAAVVGYVFGRLSH